MKIRVAVEAYIDARDRRRCLTTCRWWDPSWWDPSWDLDLGRNWCNAYTTDLSLDSRGRPLRCRECIAREVNP